MRKITITSTSEFWLFSDTEGGTKQLPRSQYSDLFTILTLYEARGYTVHIAIAPDGSEIGTATIAPITRIDSRWNGTNFAITSYTEGWTATTPAPKPLIKSESENIEVLKVLLTNEWFIVNWEFGDGQKGWRAFAPDSEVRSVRTQSDIKRLRTAHPFAQCDFALAT